MHYRSQWYTLRGAQPLLFGMGIHGQNLFVDRAQRARSRESLLAGRSRWTQSASA